MGNCLNFVSSNVKSENARVSDNASNHPSRATTKPRISTAPATVAARLTPLTLCTPSHTQGSSSGSLPMPRTKGEILSSRSLKAFTFNELKTATRNFRPDSLVGEGGFGYVFKGWIDSQTFTASKPGLGMVVAVKKLKPEGFQGHKEWLTEVNYLSQLHHPNLVKLIGYCLDGDHRLLVYEFMPRGSLENHLFRRGPQPLSWATRIKVAITAAKGLTFLHDPERQVIYRDVKASNILLDSEFNAKLSDFGLAKAGPTGDKTHVSTQVIGTQGYAAPEYIATGHLSAKADIYSFGVVLLELLSGRPAFDSSKSSTEQNLVDWAKPWLGDKRKLFRIMDSKLEGQYPKKVAYALASLTLQCISNEPKQRPRMSEVLPVLEQLQDPKNADKILQNICVKSRTRKKSPMRHNASPHRSTPSSLSLQQTPHASPLRHTPPRSPIWQTPGRSPLRRTPGGSPLWQTSGGSPLRQTPGRSPLPSNRQSPSMH